ncbi:MAG: enoyl-CoA hydratase-related protein [Duganella sp.]
MTAEYQVHGAVAVITLNNPPVNGMGLATRTAAVAGIERALADDAVTAIVITGAGKAFSGGADIREFNSPKALEEPSLHTFIATAESATKPVVAAIHTICMGGGLELSLGCHYRVAMPGARVALPEVKLGLLPGAGGTQRLPRVLGLEAALKMIVTGDPVLSEQLADTPLFDAVFAADADLLSSAVAFAESIAAIRPLPKVRERTVEHANPQAVLAYARQMATAQAPGYPAPLECIATVGASVTMPFDEGMAFERARFMHLIVSPESQALRHAFFAERVAAKVPDLAPDTPLRTIRTAAVVGAGPAAGDIVTILQKAGITVTALSSAIASSELADADLVIENLDGTLEDMQALLRQLAAVVKQGAILATTSTTLDINALAAVSGRPQDVIGLHFSRPVQKTRLLEVGRTAHTAMDVLATALALAKRLHKTVVVANLGAAGRFIGPRMIDQYQRLAAVLLEQGASADQVNQAAERFGFAQVPFGQAGAPGATKLDISDAEIAGRLVDALVKEGARLLEEGVALRASDIDIVHLAGYGFPPYRGGPMFYANAAGLSARVRAPEK